MEDEEWGLWEGQCVACDRYAPVDDMMMCEDCGSKLERDFLRQRNWAYAASAFGLDPVQQEALRRQVIEQFGADLELITFVDDSAFGEKTEEKPDRP